MKPRDGQHIEYHDDGETVRSVENYENGKRNGTIITYWPNGALCLIGAYVDDKLCGQIMEYWDDGSLVSKIWYVDGNIQGPRTAYYEIGAVFSVTDFVDSKRHGSYTEYYSNGKTRIEETYVNDKFYGKRTWYAEDGTPSVTFHGTTDETHGKDITQKQHDIEMEAFGERRAAARTSIYEWLLVARHFGVSKDVARMIGERLFDEELFGETVEVAYFLKWVEASQTKSRP